jgi:hypothetical protein
LFDANTLSEDGTVSLSGSAISVGMLVSLEREGKIGKTKKIITTNLLLRCQIFGLWLVKLWIRLGRMAHT